MSTKSEADEGVGVIVGDFWGGCVVRGLAEQYEKEVGLDVRLEPDVLDLEKFVRGRRQIVVLPERPVQDSRKWIYGLTASQLCPTAYVVGWAKVVVVARVDSPVAVLTCADIGAIVGAKEDGARWNGTRIRAYGEAGGAICGQVIQNRCTQLLARGERQMRFAFGGNWRECAGGRAVLDSVRADPSGIGFLLCREPVAGVKILAIHDPCSGRDVLPVNDTLLEPNYPLSEPLVLYLHPNQPEGGKQFCEWAVGPEGSAIAEKSGLITTNKHRQAEGRARVAEFLAGKGVVVSGVSCGVLRDSIAGLLPAFAIVKKAVQFHCGAMETDLVAMGVFVGPMGESAATSQPTFGGRELLLLVDRPSDRALQVHGRTWTKLNPTDCMIAGRAAGVVVNAANKVESLTMEQVRGVFSGEIDDWNGFGKTALSASGKTVGRGSTKLTVNKINCYGLKSDPASSNSAVAARDAGAAKLFHGECLTSVKFGRVALKKDSNDVIAAVGMDPQGIGFVDLTAAGPASPYGGSAAPSGSSVKVLAIQLGLGEKAKLIWPTEENIKNAMYPLSQRLYLYVHPRASDVAKDFAKFLATCGGSEATPYADTVKSVMEAYAKHGLIPLADAAIERRAKDAAAAARVAAGKAEKEKLGGAKRGSKQ